MKIRATLSRILSTLRRLVLISGRANDVPLAGDDVPWIQDRFAAPRKRTRRRGRRNAWDENTRARSNRKPSPSVSPFSSPLALALYVHVYETLPPPRSLLYLLTNAPNTPSYHEWKKHSSRETNNTTKLISIEKKTLSHTIVLFLQSSIKIA